MTKTAQPMIQLEPNGVAPILSYNVPEAISHSGRNFIDLRIPDSYFIKLPAGSKPPSARAETSAVSAPAFDLSNGVLKPNDASPEQIKTALKCAIAAANLPPSDALEQLDPQEVIAMARAGRQLRLYRSMYGTLNYTYVDARPATTAETSVRPELAFAPTLSSALPQDQDPSDDPNPPGPGTTVKVTIQQPGNGAVISGPDTGASFTVSGTASAKPVGGQSGGTKILNVEVQVGVGAPFKPATVSTNGDWSYAAKATASGSLVITVRAYTADNMGEAKAAVNVALQPPDKTAPLLTLSSPANNTEISGGHQGVSVALQGQASDESGIKSVQFFLDDSPISSGNGQPKAPNDWSSWSGSVLITTPGIHQILVRATDNRGNINERTVNLMVKLEAEVVSRLNRIILVESYRMSSFLGDYGAGKTIKTFSLLPGEKARISIKTYTRNESAARQASSILDSFRQESADDFEQFMENEQSNRQSYQESSMYRVDAMAEARWGWGSARVDAQLAGDSRSTREEFAKNVSNATQKHVAKASAKREVEVNTSYEVKQQSGEETSLEREIENINVSRTLNFVFRQMNQEFITLLHLVDVRVGFFRLYQENGEEKHAYQEVALSDLDTLLAQAIVPEKRTEVRNAILRQFAHIFDYEDKPHTFVEEASFVDAQGNALPGAGYLRTKRGYVSEYHDPASNFQVRVPGIILAANKYVLRTEGIVVEALLGQGEALDEYSNGLQQQAIEEKTLHNARLAFEVEKLKLAKTIIENKDEEAAKLYEMLFRPVPVAATEAPAQGSVTAVPSMGSHVLQELTSV
jgi:hypothetical protein